MRQGRDPNDGRRLRADQLRERPGLGEPTEPAQGRILVRVAAGSVPVAGSFFTGDLVETVLGDESEGGAAEVTVGTSQELIYLHGVEGDPRLTGPLVAGDLIGAWANRYRWATWRPPPPNPKGCWDCKWPTMGPPWPTVKLNGNPLATTDGLRYTGCSTTNCTTTTILLTLDPDTSLSDCPEYHSDSINGNYINFDLTITNPRFGSLTFGPFATTQTGEQIADQINAAIGGSNITGTGGPLSGSFAGTEGTSYALTFGGAFACDALTATSDNTCIVVNTNSTGGSVPLYFTLDLQTCTLTIQAFMTVVDNICQGPGTGYTCADLPNGTAHPGDTLFGFVFGSTGSTSCTPLGITFDTSAGTIDSETNCFEALFGIGPYNPAPIYQVTGDDIPGPFAWARCLGTSGDLAMSLTLTDPYGTGAAALDYDGLWSLPVAATFPTRAGWWGCWEVAVPDQCAGSGTITVPVVGFLDKLTCGFLLYYKGATLDAFGNPTDGCADKFKPRAGTCTGGDGAGDGWGVGAGSTTYIPVIGPSALAPTRRGAGNTWLTVDSYDPLHVSIVLDRSASKQLYGVDGPVVLTLTGT